MLLEKVNSWEISEGEQQGIRSLPALSLQEKQKCVRNGLHQERMYAILMN